MCNKQKTIVLWDRGDLLSSSVELFLTAQKGWHVFNLPNDENLEILKKTVDELNPDVVILHRWDRSNNVNLPTILLHDHPGLKVITVNPENSLLEVYSKQNIMVKSVTDLISVIEGSPVILKSAKKAEMFQENSLEE